VGCALGNGVHTGGVTDTDTVLDAPDPDTAFDALMLLSFGGPNGPDDVMPFLRNVTAGRNVPDERLAVVAEQYELFGGASPINQQNLALIDALRTEFAAHGIDLPIYFGNRNWEPYVADTVQQMANAGVRRALVLATSAFSSYSGCRQYREDLERAAAEVDGAPELHKLRLYYNHPGFIDAVVDRVREVHQPGARLVFTAHSIPNSMAQWCEYQPQLTEMAGLVADRVGTVGENGWDLCYQSRSGPPQVPWLEPDVNDHLEALAEQGVTAVTLVPLGFVSDHMEVKFDLDHQAMETAERVGIELCRAPTVGTHPTFVTGLRQLVEEQIAGGKVLWVGEAGPWPDPCPDGHCLPPPGAPSGRPR
jgi:ferrochelatase